MDQGLGQVVAAPLSQADNLGQAGQYQVEHDDLGRITLHVSGHHITEAHNAKHMAMGQWTRPCRMTKSCITR